MSRLPYTIMKVEIYPELDLPGLKHLFTLRGEAASWEPCLIEAGFPLEAVVRAEQTHGNGVGRVTDPAQHYFPEVDALATALTRVPLLIRVADCGPVYFYDPVKRVIALAHSGKKGTSLNIVAATVEALKAQWSVNPSDLRVFLGPCIRPPYYEVDFAAQIRNQALAAGVGSYVDSGRCTASHLNRYYSYRAEKGQTGRMCAVLMLEALET